MPYKSSNHKTIWQRKWRAKHPEWKDYLRKYSKKYRLKIKTHVLIHYNGNPPRCACCGESHIEFLTIDHINGGGCQHRKRIGKLGGWVFYRWLINNNFPEGFQVLCANCNLGKGICGECPHKNET
jgi:hypothetical protein